MREAIRKVWSRYSLERKEALWQARRTYRRVKQDGTPSVKPDVYYVCASCAGEFKATEVQVDHRVPIGVTPDFPPEAESTAWTEWMLKLFCPPSNLQVLCKECHRSKTAGERNEAAAQRRNQK